MLIAFTAAPCSWTVLVPLLKQFILFHRRAELVPDVLFPLFDEFRFVVGDAHFRVAVILPVCVHVVRLAAHLLPPQLVLEREILDEPRRLQRHLLLHAFALELQVPNPDLAQALEKRVRVEDHLGPGDRDLRLVDPGAHLGVLPKVGLTEQRHRRQRVLLDKQAVGLDSSCGHFSRVGCVFEDSVQHGQREFHFLLRVGDV
mmetsp:Transcript_29008/g.73307  ORF Transcript_29008/g.73307 Transcript_29008/m.73307 type:complete len:201 (-) Transcript_29008:60-662(-)